MAFENKLDRVITEERNLELVDLLSEDQGQGFISSSSIIDLLNKADIPYLLVGAHA
ncbi:MAG: hypothetical protein JRI80_18245, partial [Deltaproteobacteria bacterium]|nr:hypothetical protein [Deltaproteobacteria bacterium]